MGNFTVIYDACVLYPAPMRDLLMHLALSDLFRARWTDQIHEEWISNLLKNRPDLTRPQLERTRDFMNAKVRDCVITDYQHLISSISLPDQNDRHVVAAAYHGRGDCIVTFNIKHFPALELKKYHLEALHPDDFILNQIDLNPTEVCKRVAACRASLKNPPKTTREYLDRLEANQLTKSVAALKKYWDFL